MIVVSNRIPLAKGQEAAFEERFRGRAGLVENHPGFVRLEILRSKPVTMHGGSMGGSESCVVLTYWENEQAFAAWTESEDFRQAHANPPPKDDDRRGTTTTPEGSPCASPPASARNLADVTSSNRRRRANMRSLDAWATADAQVAGLIEHTLAPVAHRAPFNHPPSG